MKPLISIITPAYNSEKFIEKTILSVINQDFTPYEYIIVDGNSTDKTLDIVNKYKSHIDCLISEPDKGMYDAINKGIMLAKGDIIAYLNSDDIYLPNALKKIAGKYEDKKFDLCFGYTKFIGPDDEAKFTHKAINFSPYNVLALQRLPFCQQSCFFSRQLYDRLNGFDANLKYVGDTKFFLSAYKLPNLKTIIIKSYLAAFRLHDDCLSIAQKEMMQNERELMMKQLAIGRGKDKYSGMLRKVALESILKTINFQAVIKKYFKQ
jgi:glycosyltransferase involved in cell wall biosynthesis